MQDVDLLVIILLIGGIAGEGGIITVSQLAKVYAYNGNRFTDGTDYASGNNQCPIYAQNGIYLAKYTDKIEYGDPDYWSRCCELVENYRLLDLSGYTNTASNAQTPLTLNSNFKCTIAGTDYYFLKNIDMSKQGVGSGAGYTEISNGTYNVDTTGSMN